MREQKEYYGIILKIIGLSSLIIGTTIGLSNIILDSNRFKQAAIAIAGGTTVLIISKNISTKNKEEVTVLNEDLLVKEEKTRKLLSRI